MKAQAQLKPQSADQATSTATADELMDAPSCDGDGPTASQASAVDVAAVIQQVAGPSPVARRVGGPPRVPSLASPSLPLERHKPPAEDPDMALCPQMLPKSCGVVWSEANKLGIADLAMADMMEGVEGGALQSVEGDEAIEGDEVGKNGERAGDEDVLDANVVDVPGASIDKAACADDSDALRTDHTLIMGHIGGTRLVTPKRDPPPSPDVSPTGDRPQGWSSPLFVKASVPPMALPPALLPAAPIEPPPPAAEVVASPEGTIGALWAAEGKDVADSTPLFDAGRFTAVPTRLGFAAPSPITPKSNSATSASKQCGITSNGILRVAGPSPILSPAASDTAAKSPASDGAMSAPRVTSDTAAESPACSGSTLASHVDNVTAAKPPGPGGATPSPNVDGDAAKSPAAARGSFSPVMSLSFSPAMPRSSSKAADTKDANCLACRKGAHTAHTCCRGKSALMMPPVTPKPKITAVHTSDIGAEALASITPPHSTDPAAIAASLELNNLYLYDDITAGLAATLPPDTDIASLLDSGSSRAAHSASDDFCLSRATTSPVKAKPIFDAPADASAAAGEEQEEPYDEMSSSRVLEMSSGRVLEMSSSRVLEMSSSRVLEMSSGRVIEQLSKELSPSKVAATAAAAAAEVDEKEEAMLAEAGNMASAHVPTRWSDRMKEQPDRLNYDDRDSANLLLTLSGTVGRHDGKRQLEKSGDVIEPSTAMVLYEPPVEAAKPKKRPLPPPPFPAKEASAAKKTSAVRSRTAAASRPHQIPPIEGVGGGVKLSRLAAAKPTPPDGDVVADVLGETSSIWQVVEEAMTEADKAKAAAGTGSALAQKKQASKAKPRASNAQPRSSTAAPSHPSTAMVIYSKPPQSKPHNPKAKSAQSKPTAKVVVLNASAVAKPKGKVPSGATTTAAGGVTATALGGKLQAGESKMLPEGWWYKETAGASRHRYYYGPAGEAL